MTNSNSNTTDHTTINTINNTTDITTDITTINTTTEPTSGPLADGSTSPDSITKALYHALKRLNRLMHRMGHQEPDQNGLFRGQAHLLGTVRTNNGIVQRDLAEKLDIRPSSLTEMLAKMEQDGFVERRQDDKDQRLMHIHLTTKGMQYLEMMAESEEYQMKTLFRSLSDEEALTMLTLCNKLGTGLDNQSGAPEEKRHCGRGGLGHRCGRHGGGLPGESPIGEGPHGHERHHHDHHIHHENPERHEQAEGHESHESHEHHEHHSGHEHHEGHHSENPVQRGHHCRHHHDANAANVANVANEANAKNECLKQ